MADAAQPLTSDEPVQMFRKVLERASILALCLDAWNFESGAGPPHSKTLPRLPVSLNIY